MRADDQWGIRDVIAGYCHACDEGDARALAELFAADAEYAVGESTYVGRDAIEAHFVDVRPIASIGKHMTSNTVVSFSGPDRASAISDWAYLVDSEGLVVLAAGRYLDDFVRAGDAWLFTRRRIAVFDRP